MNDTNQNAGKGFYLDGAEWKPLYDNTEGNASMKPYVDISHMTVEEKAQLSEKILDYLWEQYYIQWPM